MLIDYTHEILFPAMDERFATKEDVNELKIDVSSLRSDFDKFRDESLTRQDNIIKKLDILLQEKKVADYQQEKQKQFFLIITKALAEHKILKQTHLKQIAKLEIF